LILRGVHLLHLTNKKNQLSKNYSSNNNPGIETKIVGDMYLDIPSTNSGFSDLENYKNIAKTYGIALRLIAE
jgi:hypothetical protein